MLVIGSRNSSNSVRLVEVAHDCGTDAHLIDNAGEVREEWLDGRRVVGISSGASAPENLVQELVDFFRARGVPDISELDVVREDVRFMLPKPSARPWQRRGRRARARAGSVSVMRTLIVSDLHLGGALRASTCCAAPRLRAALLGALDDVDRLVLLGDVLELRHGPPHEALAAARPFFEDLGRALAGRELVITAGNHDHCSVDVAGCARAASAAGAARPRAALRPRAGLADARAARRVGAPARVERGLPGPVGAPRRVCHTRPLPRLPSDRADARAPRRGGDGASAGTPTRQSRTVEDYEAITAPIFAWRDAAPLCPAPAPP